MRKHDVVIVGLGPTGATLAALLGQRGFRVAVFDRLPDLYPLPRAAGLDHEVMRIMQELHLADRVEPYVRPYRPSEYRGMNGQLIKRLEPAPAPYRSGWLSNYVFNQPEFERAIRARLAELPTVEVFLESEIVESGQDADRAWIDVRARDSSRVARFAAPYLIACDGATSPTRKRLGITLQDLQFDEPWLVVDAIVSDEKLAELPETNVQYCEAQRPSTYVVGVGNHRRWEIMLLPGDSLSPEYPPEELWPLLARWIKPGEGEIWRAAAYRFRSLVADEWRRDRIILAGDAVHMTPPFMAQGMVQGLRDAQNLAWKLQRVLGGKSPDSLLDSYPVERRPHVMATTEAAIGLGRVICERDPERARSRDDELLREQGGEVRTTIRQNMIPNLSSGILATEAAGVGELFPQPTVRSDSFEGRLDDLTGCTIRVLVEGPIDSEAGASLEAAVAELDGVLVHLGDGAFPASAQHVVEQEPVLAPWLREHGSRVAIVRPDHYVFGTASTLDSGLALLKSLSAQLAH